MIVRVFGVEIEVRSSGGQSVARTVRTWRPLGCSEAHHEPARFGGGVKRCDPYCSHPERPGFTHGVAEGGRQ